MAAFATAEDVATAARRDLDAEDTATVSYLLDVASEMIRGFVGWQFDGGTDTARALNGVSQKYLLLPFAPVNTITTITNDGTAVTAGTDSSQYTLYGPEGVLYREAGWNEVVVTYTHGYTVIPDDVRGVAVDMVKRALENPAGLQREDLNTASQWLGLTAENRYALRRYVPVLI